MRTREEQVDNLTDALDVFDGNHPKKSAIHGYKRHADAQNIAQQHIVEAEQRGYERARAECAADTRRLEWLEKLPFADVGRLTNGWEICINNVRHWDAQPTLREAIDAAMETK